MEITLKFEKEHDTFLGRRWYAVVPEWEGAKAELEMVENADLLLDLIAQGEESVHVKFNIEPFEGSNLLELLNLDTEIGGGWYMVKNYEFMTDLNLRCWLCSVTEFVMGSIPEKIYFKKV